MAGELSFAVDLESLDATPMEVVSLASVGISRARTYSGGSRLIRKSSSRVLETGARLRDVFEAADKAIGLGGGSSAACEAEMAAMTEEL